MLVPGEFEEEHMKFVEKRGGVRYIGTVMKACEKLSKRLDIPPIEPIDDHHV